MEKCLEEERQRNKEALVSAAKLEKEAMKDAVLKAIEEERKHMEKVHAEERSCGRLSMQKIKRKYLRQFKQLSKSKEKLVRKLLRQQ